MFNFGEIVYSQSQSQSQSFSQVLQSQVSETELLKSLFTVYWYGWLLLVLPFVDKYANVVPEDLKRNILQFKKLGQLILLTKSVDVLIQLSNRAFAGKFQIDHVLFSLFFMIHIGCDQDALFESYLMYIDDLPIINDNIIDVIVFIFFVMTALLNFVGMVALYNALRLNSWNIVWYINEYNNVLYTAIFTYKYRKMGMGIGG